MESKLSRIKCCSSLFLDRDGVINKRIIDGYVTKPSEFIFIDGVLDAMNIFNKMFKYIFIVTNQQGIGKGLMSVEDLDSVHDYMLSSIENHGGRITEIFYCPYLEKQYHPDRKPDIGMGLKAKCKYPDVDFKNSVMVGDSKTDIQFGKRLNMNTIFIGDKSKTNADLCFDSLFDFAQSLTM